MFSDSTLDFSNPPKKTCLNLNILYFVLDSTQYSVIAEFLPLATTSTDGWPQLEARSFNIWTDKAVSP